MFEKITIKDIIALNQKFAEGHMMNQSSMFFALDQASLSKSWLRACAILVRAVLIDHVFEEGNKRTAAAIIVAFLEENDVSFHPEFVAKIVASIVLKNINEIIIIERMIKNVII